MFRMIHQPLFLAFLFALSPVLILAQDHPGQSIYQQRCAFATTNPLT